MSYQECRHKELLSVRVTNCSLKPVNQHLSICPLFNVLISTVNLIPHDGPSHSLRVDSQGKTRYTSCLETHF